MIIEDSREMDCFGVGTDNIGDYWEYDGKWNHHNGLETKVKLPNVLLAVGLTQKRYHQYLSLFENVGAIGVEHCRETVFWGRWIRVLVFRSGLAVSACTGTIEWYEHNPPLLGGNRGDGYFDVQMIENGWQSMVDCT